MLGTGFSIRDAISFGWNKSLEHIFLIVKIALTFTAVEIVLLLGLLPIGLLLYVTGESFLSLIPITLLIAYVFAAALFMIGMVRLGLLRVLLDIYERNRSEVSRLFSVFNLTFTYIGAAILYSFIFTPVAIISGFASMVLPPVFVGLMLIAVFVIMFILRIRLGFYVYPIVDKGFGVLDSLKRSWEITEGSVVRLMIFEIVLGLIPLLLGVIATANILAIIAAMSQGWYFAAIFSALLLMITLFSLALVIPLVLLANVYAYKKLSAHADERNHDISHLP